MNWLKQSSLTANPEKLQSMLISHHACDVDGLKINVEYTTSSTEKNDNTRCEDW